jgi:hypothetical protein
VQPQGPGLLERLIALLRELGGLFPAGLVDRVIGLDPKGSSLTFYLSGGPAGHPLNMAVRLGHAKLDVTDFFLIVKFAELPS